MTSVNHQKSLEVAVTFSEILVMTRQKSHAFDSEKVGRYSTCHMTKYPTIHGVHEHQQFIAKEQSQGLNKQTHKAN